MEFWSSLFIILLKEVFVISDLFIPERAFYSERLSIIIKTLKVPSVKNHIAVLSEESSDPKSLFLIGVGASAGGIEALTAFISGLPSCLDNFVIIVAQHINPTHKSSLDKILANKNEFPVLKAEDGMVLKKRIIYITPPDFNITVKNRKINLTRAGKTPGERPSINNFFDSLAKEANERAIAIILSGAGRDGAEGIKEIKACGGFVIVQEPRTAKFNLMPLAAIETEMVDEVLLPEKMGEEIRERMEKVNIQNFTKLSFDEEPLYQIFSLVKQRTGTDFSDYKFATIQRRIEKRLSALKIPSLTDYLKYVNGNQEELDELYKVFLIGVTTFFRDMEAFQALKNYLRLIMGGKKRGDNVRIWVAGCSTGEEAYTIAILLYSLLEDGFEQFKIKIFATDIDEGAIAVARRGLYSKEAVSGVPGDILNRFFVQKNDQYEVVKLLKSVVLFSKHDLTSNPPFLKMDMVSCRNLMIYFNNTLQKQILPVFHYALNVGGYLFLGKSENIAAFKGLFTVVDSKNKIFQKKSSNGLKLIDLPHYHPVKVNGLYTSGLRDYQEEESVNSLIKETLFNTFEHSYVVLNAAADIVHVSGDLRLYMTFRDGNINANIFKMINSELQYELRALISTVKKSGRKACSPVLSFQLFNMTHFVRLVVKPLISSENDSDLLLLVFEKQEPDEYLALFSSPQNDSEVESIRVKELERELSATKDQLNLLLEELESNKEEFQAINEELQSAVEELQSSNEELETANEELQSSNEEVQVAYSEIKTINDELERKEKLLKDNEINLNALLNNTLQSFVLVDSAYNILAYNSIASETFERLSNKHIKVGESIIDMISPAYLQSFIQEFQIAVGGNIFNGERCELDRYGKQVWLRYNFTPVASSTGKVKVISVGIIDITELKNALSELNATEKLASSVFNATSTGMLIIDQEGVFVDVNSESCTLLGYSRKELIGNNIGFLLPEENREEVLKLHHAFMKGPERSSSTFIVQRKDGALIDIYETSEVLVNPDGTRYRVTSFRDITEKKKYENLLLETQSISGTGGWQLEVNSNQLSLTDEVYKLFRIEKNDFISFKMIIELFEREDSEKFARAVDEAIQNGLSFMLELKYRRKGGDIRWMRVKCNPERLKSKTIRLYGVFQDITERIKYEKKQEEGIADYKTSIEGLISAEKVLKTSEERYRLLFHDNPLPMWLFNTENLKFIEVNKAAIDKYGYSREEFMNMTAADVRPKEKVKSFLTTLKKFKQDQSPYTGSALHRKKDGSIIHVEVTCHHFSYDGQPAALVLANDITKKVEAEKMLVSKNKEFNKILESITDGFFVVDKSWRITYWNQENKGRLRVLHSQIEGMNLWDVFPDLRFREEYRKAIKENIPVHFQEYYAALKVWLDISIYPFGEGLSVFYKDITQKKRIEKLESLGKVVLEMNALPESSLEQTLSFYLKEIENIHDGLYCSVMLLKEGKLYNLAAPGLPEPYFKAIDGLEIGPDAGSCGSAAYHAQEIIASDIENDPHWARFSEYFKFLEFKACWSYPIIGFDHKVLGTFAIYSKEAKSPSEDEKNTIEIVRNLLLVVLENKLADMALRRSNERYDLVAKATNDTIWDWDLQTNYVYRTFASFNKLFGYEKEDLKRNRDLWLESIHPSDFERVVKKLQQVLDDPSCEYWEDEFRFRKANGEYAYINEKGYIKRNAEGKVERMIGATQDITARKKAEEELLKLSLVARETENVVIITNLQGEIIWVNEAFQKVTGYTIEEVEGKRPGSFLHGKETDQHAVNYVRKQIKNLQPFQCELINYNKSGEKYWVRIQAQPIKDRNGEGQFFFAIETDITRQKEEEQQLKLLESVITNTNDAVVITEHNKQKKSDTTVVYVNPQFLEETGFTEKEVIGYDFLALQGQRTGKGFINNLRKIINEGKVFEGEVKYLKRDGKEAIFEMRIFPIKDNAGVITHYVCIQKDITRSKKMKFYLQMAFKQLQFHIDNTTLATVQWDEGLNIKSWSNQAEQILGWKKSDILGENLINLNLIHEEDFTEVLEKFNEVLAGKENTSFDFTIRALSKEGTTVYTEWHNSLLFDEDGEFLSFLTLIRDITTIKLAEKAMIEGQDQERKRIAREIHDGIGQMLIALKYKIASFDYETEEYHYQMVKSLEELVAQTIDEVRLVSYNLAPRSLEEMGIEVAVNNLCEQTKKLTGLNIVFQYIGGSVNANRAVLNTMYRITQEALNNAIKHARATNVRIKISQSVKSLTLSFEDDGRGFVIDKKLFIKGNGLRNMEERAKMLNGRFQVNSTIGGGTTIFVSLPLNNEIEEELN